MDKIKLLNIGKLNAPLLARLSETYDLTDLSAESDLNGALAQIGAQFQAISTSAPVGVSAAQMDLLPNLEVISSFGVGLDKIDLAHAAERKIHVGYTPNVLNDCVADLALGLMIDVSRQISASDRFVRAGQWPVGPYPTARKVTGKNVGVVGFGRIGQEIAQRAAGFRMNIRYHTRTAKKDVAYAHEASLLDLARWADFLVIATPGGASTRHLINAAVFEALGPQGYVINIARGSVINEDDLMDALRNHRIAGAGLDVFENEPNIRPEWLTVPNLTAVPHVGSNTHETRAAMADLLFNNLGAYFAHGQVIESALSN